MTTRQRLETALSGGTPDITPLSIYNFFMGNPPWPADWQRLIDMGLGVCMHTNTVYGIEQGTQDSSEERIDGDKHYRIYRKTCPAGTLQRVTLNGWHHEDWIKTPQDYRIRKWMIEHTEPRPCYENYEKTAELVGENGIVAFTGSRTPLMSINIDWAGTERFCEDVAMEVPELFELYEAQKRLFMEEIKLMARGPGRFYKCFENLTISMIGPDRYRDYLVNVYDEAYPMLREAGKVTLVHYDGALCPIADQIAKAPFDGIESLTEPPEGNMMLDECRAAWPDKTFWVNLNVDLYGRPPEVLRDEVIAKRQRAGKRALAFEISEDVPANWKESVPVVLRTLQDLG